MSTKFELPLTSNESKPNINSIATNFSHLSATNEAKLHHSLQTIMDLQQKLLAEKETNNLLQKERDDFVSMTESLSVQLDSAQTQIKILNEETNLDKQKLNELNEHIHYQKQATLTAVETLHIMQNSGTAIPIIEETDVKNTNDQCDLYDNTNTNNHNNETETLRNELKEKNKKIETLSKSLHHMTELKVKNENLQNEIHKMQKATKNDLTNQVETIQQFEAENNELLNMNLQLNHEREQLINDIVNTKHESPVHINEDILTAPYDLKLPRRMSNASQTSHASTTVFASNPLCHNDVYDTEIFKSYSRDLSDNYNPYLSPYDSDHNNMSNNQLTKQDLILNNIIHEYKTKLAKVNQENEKLATQLNKMVEIKGFKSRKSGSDVSDVSSGYMNEEEEDNKYENENDYRVIIKHESDIDNDNDFEEVYSVCDYTTVTTNSVCDDHDLSDLDEEEKLIEQSRSDCNVGPNIVLLVKNLFTRWPFGNR